MCGIGGLVGTRPVNGAAVAAMMKALAHRGPDDDGTWRSPDGRVILGARRLAILDPTLAILDETDSGLDIDALQIVAAGVNTLRSAERAMIVVTHYQRLLNYIITDFVHVLVDGRIVKSGAKELALELEAKGYAWVEAEARTTAATHA